MKKKPKTNRMLGCLMAALLSVVGITGMTAGVNAASPVQEPAPLASIAQAGVSLAVQAVGSKGSIMLDTAQYTMAPGDTYTIGAFLKDAKGNAMDASQVRALVDGGALVVKDSRTGSIVDLVQLSTGHFRVVGKNEGTAYIIYEIGGTHASVRIDVKKGAKASGSAVRNTSYFTSDIPEVKPIPAGPKVALTFDDGPNGKVTQRIVNTLQKYDAKGTFFMVGNRVMSDQETVKKVYASGSEIASHSYDHSDLTRLSASGVQYQIQQPKKLIRQIVPYTPKLFRPPFGATNASVRNVSSVPFILWSIDTRDWEHRNASKTVQAVLSQVKDGDIILMHDLQPSTADACETLIPELKKRGYQLVTVSELLASKGITPVAGKVYS
ncbi:MAG: polysaccharide deacetylase family protein [Clostridiales bacterium]|nr:polysaccharide deacetylase family protein [Clostridiales bacterium]